MWYVIKQITRNSEVHFSSSKILSLSLLHQFGHGELCWDPTIYFVVWRWRITMSLCSTWMAVSSVGGHIPSWVFFGWRIGLMQASIQNTGMSQSWADASELESESEISTQHGPASLSPSGLGVSAESCGWHHWLKKCSSRMGELLDPCHCASAILMNSLASASFLWCIMTCMSMGWCGVQQTP